MHKLTHVVGVLSVLQFMHSKPSVEMEPPDEVMASKFLDTHFSVLNYSDGPSFLPHHQLLRKENMAEGRKGSWVSPSRTGRGAIQLTTQRKAAFEA